MSVAKLTPQERWHLKQKSLGLCIRCGRKRKNYKSLCDYCQAKQSMYMKRYRAALKKAKEVKAKLLGANGNSR